MFPRKEFTALQEAWDEAEQAIKIAEQVTGVAIVPSINELRYAGRKIIEAAQADDESTAGDILRDARRDCFRAEHDAVDATVSLMSRHLDLLASQVGLAAIGSVVPEIGRFRLDLSAAEAEIARSRGDRGSRAEVYDRLRTANLPALKAVYDQIRVCEGDLIRDAEKRRRAQVLSLLVGVTGVAIGVIGLLAALF